MSQTDLWTEIGEKLSGLGYRLKEKLSTDSDSHSNAQVWLAEYQDGTSETLERRALKISSSLLMSSWSAKDGNGPSKLDELTLRELEIHQKLDHPHIPRFRDFHKFVVADMVDVSVLATEYIPAPNLQARIDSGTRLSDEGNARKLLEDVLSALDHVHTKLDQPVLHRDIKPSNILYDEADKAQAYLFDFNFSQIGHKTVASTVIDNYGYYPPDAYSGMQTPSQDLCALGNVVIAAAHGKDISAVRAKQDKAGLDAVDVDDLPYSPKLKRFLKKLTTSNPAFRYQTAEQALDDLRNLEKLTQEALEQRLTTIVRGKGLTRLLEKLQEQDRLFDYNVPPNIKSTYGDERLLEHLRRTYAQDEFVIDDPREIQKYITIGDRVVKKGTYREIAGELKNNEEGIVQSVKEAKVAVKFLQGVFSVDRVDLLMIGKEKFWKNERYSVIAATEVAELARKHIVRYTGETKTEYREDTVIPDGAKGVALFVNSNQHWAAGGVSVVWENAPGLRQKIRIIFDGSTSTRSCRLEKYFPYDSITLIKGNHVDFEGLYARCFGG